jgi:hypothetical protein
MSSFETTKWILIELGIQIYSIFLPGEAMQHKMNENPNKECRKY